MCIRDTSKTTTNATIDGTWGTVTATVALATNYAKGDSTKISGFSTTTSTNDVDWGILQSQLTQAVSFHEGGDIQLAARPPRQVCIGGTWGTVTATVALATNYA